MNFKQKSIALLSCGVLLAGCSSSPKPVVKDDKDVVASITDKDYFADDLFSIIKKSPTGESAYFEAVLDKLINHLYPINEVMENDAKTTIEQVESAYASNYGSTAETQLASDLQAQGFSDLQDYKDSLIVALQYAQFLENYITNHYDDVLNDYMTSATPRTLAIIQVSVADMEKITDDEKATLDEVTKLVNSSKDFNELAKERSSHASAANSGKLGIVDANIGLASTFGAEFEKQAFLLKDGEITKEAIKGNDGYYFIKCISTQKADIENEVKDLGIDSPLISYDSYMVYDAFKTYEISYESDESKKLIEDYITGELKERDEKRAEKEAEETGDSE